MRFILKDKQNGQIRVYQAPREKIMLSHIQSFVRKYCHHHNFVLTFYTTEKKSQYGLQCQKLINNDEAFNQLLLESVDLNFVKIYVRVIPNDFSAHLKIHSNQNIVKQNHSVNSLYASVARKSVSQQKILDRIIQDKLNNYLQTKVDNVIQDAFQQYIDRKQKVIERSEYYGDLYTSKIFNDAQISHINNSSDKNPHYTQSQQLYPSSLFNECKKPSKKMTSFSRVGPLQRKRFLSIPSKISSSRVSSKKIFIQGSTHNHTNSLFVEIRSEKNNSSRHKRKKKKCICEPVNKYTNQIHYGFTGSAELLPDFSTNKDNSRKRISHSEYIQSQSNNQNYFDKDIKLLIEDSSTINKDEQKSSKSKNQLDNSMKSLRFLQEDIKSMRDKGRILLKMQEIFIHSNKSQLYRFIEDNQNLSQSEIIDKWLLNFQPSC